MLTSRCRALDHHLCSFEQDILPWLNLGIKTIESSMLGSLLVTGALVTSAQSSKEHREFVPDYHRAFEQALSEAVRPWENENAGHDSGALGHSDDYWGMDEKGFDRSMEDAALSDVLGILFVSLPLAGRKKQLSSYLRCAHGMILDSMSSVTPSQEDKWRSIWERLHASHLYAAIALCFIQLTVLPASSRPWTKFTVLFILSLQFFLPIHRIR